MLYRVGYYVLKFLCKTYFNFKVKGVENASSLKDGAVLISNHQSNMDPIFLGLAFKKRKLFFMAKQELFNNFFLSRIISSLGAFPVERGKKDFSAIENAVKLVKNGKIVAMFPEGTRSKTKKLLKPKSGAVRIAISGNVKILPVSIKIEGFSFKNEIEVRFGEIVDVKSIINAKNLNFSNLTVQNYRDVMAIVWEKVKKLNFKQKEEQN